ncbi:hypothetical protein [Streptomyces sp. NBC_01243]|uniref:hypothetical protein n=1 Tax=Streptomyces sp. NBC_01243 TaxID=2903796 RepID=UPI002E0F1F03|nr:hypothetical protein OG348_06115 [Streptomyces sp. NBC_01243]
MRPGTRVPVRSEGAPLVPEVPGAGVPDTRRWTVPPGTELSGADPPVFAPGPAARDRRVGVGPAGRVGA